jgi:hypothetical protein
MFTGYVWKDDTDWPKCTHWWRTPAEGCHKTKVRAWDSVQGMSVICDYCLRQNSLQYFILIREYQIRWYENNFMDTNPEEGESWDKHGCGWETRSDI